LPGLAKSVQAVSMVRYITILAHLCQPERCPQSEEFGQEPDFVCIPESLLRPIEDEEERGHRDVGEQVNQRPQQRHCRNKATKDTRDGPDEIRCHKDGQDKHSDQGQSCRILQSQGRSMDVPGVESKAASRMPYSTPRMAQDASESLCCPSVSQAPATAYSAPPARSVLGQPLLWRMCNRSTEDRCCHHHR
jgi:hypothetical protein